MDAVVEAARTPEEYKLVRDAMEGMARMYTQKHAAACEQWHEGEPTKVWHDDDGNLCVEYESGRWWHYNERGEWW